MTRRGFTLIEVMMGLFLLGLVSLTVIPILNTSFMNMNRQKERADMIYTAEMVIERLKAYEGDSTDGLYVLDREVGDIIQLLRTDGQVEIEIGGTDKYPVRIVKEDKSKLLWTIDVFVYNRDWSNGKHVEVMAYLQAM
ncbi:MAG: type II secretion system protein [Tissierellaceae bacterium]